MEYKYLFTPLKIGPVTIKNRCCFGPNCPMTAGNFVDGLFGEDSIHYYAERAKGGQGLIIIGNTRVSKGTIFWPYCDPQLFDDRAIPPLKKIADEVHKYGTKLFIQLFYGGAERTYELQESSLYGDPDIELAALGPSQIPYVLFPQVVTKTMSVDEIKEIEEDFGRAARRAREAGLDGVEIHSSVDYLHAQFLSPIINRRQDQYGGSMENRARFLIETLQKVREYIGEEIALGYRITTDTLWPGDNTIDDMKEVVKYVNSQVKVDYINTILAGFHSPLISPAIFGGLEPGYEMPYTAQIKAAVDVPVLGNGSFNDPRLAEEALAKGQCDVISMIRQMFADPEFANKAMEGREDDIRTCVRTNYCLSRSFRGLRVNCIQNPTVGREKIWGIGTIKPAEVRRKILIVGGGPAGLETARVAGLRGHEVVIYDKREEVGGRVRLQATLPRMAEIGNIASWLESQARKAGARIVTGKEVTADNLKTVLSEETPDAVVVATGAEGARDGMNGFLCQEIPGWQQENVYTYEDVLEGKVGNVRKVLLLDELSDELALGVARQLAAYAEEVQLITRHISIGQSPYVSHVNIRRELKAIYQLKNIKIVPYTFITGIEGRNVRLLFTPIDEERLEEDVDAVVLMTMFKSNNSLYPLVKDKVAEAHLIGDARAPRTTHEAIMEGQRLGRKL